MGQRLQQSAITISSIASCLGTTDSNIANLEQNGADGTTLTDTYMGFAFNLTTAAGGLSAGWHEYRIGTGTLIPADTTRPTVTVVVADTSLNADETSLVTFTFSEAVTGFTNSDITFANGTLSAVSSSDSGITWTATFIPTDATADTTNVITVDMTGVMDLAQNTGVGSTDSNNYAVDTAGPTVTLVVADTSLAAGETSLVTFTFSEPVIAFTNDDLTIANGTLSTVSTSDGGTTYTATLTPTAALTDATNVITVAMTGVTDAAGNAGSGTTDSNNYAIDTATPATEFAAKSDVIRQTLTDEATTGLTSALSANQAMVQDAKGRFVAGDTPDMALDVNGSFEANPVSVSSMGTFFGQTTQGNGTRQLVFGSFDLQRDDTTGASTVTFNSKIAWEKMVSDTTLLGYFIGGDLARSNIAGSFTGDQDHLGVTAGGYAVHEMAKQLYLDGFVSVGAGRNNLTMDDSVLALESDYTTRSATFGMSVSGVIGPQGYEIWPELALTVGRTWIDTVAFTGTAYDATDNTLSLDAGMVTLANLTFRPEFRVPLDGSEVAKSLRLITLAPRLICQQTTTTTTARTCGGGAEIGLQTHSADGTTTASAQILSDWINGQTRTSGQLSVEMRF